MRILVTGAGGFVGKDIVEEISREEIFETIKLFSAKSGKKREVTETKEGRENNYFADIANESEVSGLEKIGEIDAVIHCAGLAHQFGVVGREDFQKVNVLGTKNILLLAEKLKAVHFILISSVSVYGRQGNKKNGNETRSIDESAECFAEGFYAESKLQSEFAAKEFCERKNIKLTVLRLATVIGEEDPGNFLRLIRTIDNKRFLWIGDGINYKSLIHRNDVARACLKILSAPEKGKKLEIYNISAEPLQMKQIVEIISRELGRKVPSIRIPDGFLNFIFRINSRTLNLKAVENLYKTVEKWLADDAYSGRNLEKDYGFKPALSAEEAIEREVRWYLEQK
jgi:nucleoside-diphosphate-sugar epimerase